MYFYFYQILVQFNNLYLLQTAKYYHYMKITLRKKYLLLSNHSNLTESIIYQLIFKIIYAQTSVINI